MLLGELLLEAGAITREQLDIARRNQDLYGERLGTNLVELGFIAETKLVEVLSRKHRLPSVGATTLERISRDVLELMPASLAAKHRALPVHRDGGRLFIAVSDPTDTKGLAEIRDAIKLELRWMVAADLAITTALERHYGVERKLRKSAPPVSNDDATELDPDELMEEDDDGGNLFAPNRPGEEEPGMVAIESPLLAEVLAGALHSHATVQMPVQKASAVHAPLAPESPRLSLSTFAAKLVEAGGENDLSDATLAFLAQDFRRVVMLNHQGERLVGWRAIGGGLSDDAVRVVTLAEDDLPSAKKALEDGLPRLGIGSGMLGGLSILFGDVGKDTTLLLPVRCSGRPVACFVASGGSAGIDQRLNDFMLVARKLDLTLQILVLKKRVLE